ncbi:MAG: kynureninase [Actinomycetota bacterium]
MTDTTRERALALDAIDPLAAWRDQFDLTAPGLAGRDLIYLDGNSLGRTPLRTIERLDFVVRGEWARDLIRSWDHWLDLPQRVGDRLAPLIGAADGEVAVHDSTSVNLYQLVHGALALRPDRAVIAIDAHDFPSDRYIVDGIAAATGRTVRHGFDGLDDVAVVVRSMVDYRTAEVVDIATETARATASGALVIWDLSHAAGVLAVDLHGAGAQLAVGCTYKFLNGGPGAPAFTYVARELQAELTQPIWGWFSQREQFAMGPEYQPRPDIGRMLIGTPSILALAAADAGISVSADAGIDAIAAKATALTGFGIDLCDQWGLSTCTPREASRRGGHISVVHPQARQLCRRLIDECGVIPDFREPDIVRLGMSPLTTRFVDVHDGIEHIARLVVG